MSEIFRRTRIIATLGPASSSVDMVGRLIEAGVDVFRLNFSHGSQEVHRDNVALIRAAAAKINRSVGIMQDLQGPKIRVARFEAGAVELVPGNAFALSCGDDSPGTAERVGLTYPDLWRDVRIDDLLLLDDGRLTLRVTDVRGQTINTNVVVGGALSDNKGINVPGADLSVQAVTEKDIDDLRLGAELGVDWVALSFVRSRDDVQLARHYLARARSETKLIAKIEKPGAVERFEEILGAVDGIMVARGDLGVEVSSEQVPLIQKRLIRQAREAGKPVITATQMLETMIQSPTPTRAEASDVANAIHDGTDAIMLSGETAVGRYAVESVQMMDRIARSMEADGEYKRALLQQRPDPQPTVADSVSVAACEMAGIVAARLIVAFTMSGGTVLRLARNRYSTPILALTPNQKTFQQLSLVWGVRPVLGEQVESQEAMIASANRHILLTGLARPGDRYVITAGVPLSVQGATNMLRVESVRS